MVYIDTAKIPLFAHTSSTSQTDRETDIQKSDLTNKAFLT